MTRAIVQACLPWLGLLVVLMISGRLLVRLDCSCIRLARLRRLHGDQGGSAQTLSFVLTLPIFIMVMLLIVQISQLMIGTIVVHYAAFAAARSALVWIPAAMPPPEEANCLSGYAVDPEAPDQVPPILDPEDPNYGPGEGGMTFRVGPGSPKYEKIASAAVLACMSICPSRSVGLSLQSGTMALASLRAAYAAVAPRSDSNQMIPVRLENKLAYALQNTAVEIRFFHKNTEPPLVTYSIPEDINEFRFNELGWQDPITVTVKHNLALLPGPGRLLARNTPRADGTADEVSQTIQQQGQVYVYPLTASVTLGNEGEKSVIRYDYTVY